MDGILQHLKEKYFTYSALLGSCMFVYLTKRFYIDGGSFNDKKTRLNGKTAIVTGANTGIGKETALDFAKRGARVILACRDQKRASAAAEDIIKKSGNANIIVSLLDLASFDSIKQFAKRINETEASVHILVNNAG